MKKIIFSFFLVFSFTANAQYTNLHNLSDTLNGRQPIGDLVSDGTFLYGMSGYGGINDAGTLFKIMPDGSGYTKLHDFGGGANSAYPKGSLLYDGTYLYGTTYQGGSSSTGVVFKILTNGTGYTNILQFTTSAMGTNPTGSLISDGTYLYGMTNVNGAYSSGTIFKVKTDGSGYINVFSFNDTLTGKYPFGSLIYDGTYLYGMTQYGGANDMGSIFKVKADGSGFVKLLDFSGTTNGSYPKGSLISDGTFLYGMTEYGGANALGTVFKIKPDGSGYVDLKDFSGADGKWPRASLILDGGVLYGMTSSGGPSGYGNVFKILADGSGYVNLLNFSSVVGYLPVGSLFSDGTSLYGMTSGGFGTSISGTIFKFQYGFTGINSISEKQSFEMYPNPSDGNINILSKTEISNGNLTIFNLYGQSLLSINNIHLAKGDNYQLDISAFSNGSYILELNGYKTLVIKN